MIDHIDVCLCICKMTLQRSSLKMIINVIQIDTCDCSNMDIAMLNVQYA